MRACFSSACISQGGQPWVRRPAATDVGGLPGVEGRPPAQWSWKRGRGGEAAGWLRQRPPHGSTRAAQCSRGAAGRSPCHRASCRPAPAPRAGRGWPCSSPAGAEEASESAPCTEGPGGPWTGRRACIRTLLLRSALCLMPGTAPLKPRGANMVASMVQAVIWSAVLSDLRLCSRGHITRRLPCQPIATPAGQRAFPAHGCARPPTGTHCVTGWLRGWLVMNAFRSAVCSL